MTGSPKIVPAMLATDRSSLGEDCRRFAGAGADRIQRAMTDAR